MRPPLVNALVACAAAVLAGAPSDAHGELGQRIAAVSRELHESPRDASLYLVRGELYRLHGEEWRAATDLAMARALEPGIAGALLLEARIALGQGRYADALGALDVRLARAPASAGRDDEARAWSLRAEALDGLARPAEALLALRRALAVHDPPRPEHYLVVARRLRDGPTANGGLALQVLDEGLARLGLEPSMQLLAIELEAERGAFDAALSRLDGLAASTARRDPWLARRGDLLERAGRPRAARVAFEAALTAIRELPPKARRNQLTRARAEHVLARLAALPTES